jgi:hypothetical protein
MVGHTALHFRSEQGGMGVDLASMRLLLDFAKLGKPGAEIVIHPDAHRHGTEHRDEGSAQEVGERALPVRREVGAGGMGAHPVHGIRLGTRGVSEVETFGRRQGMKPEDERTLEGDQVVGHRPGAGMVGDPMKRQAAAGDLDLGEQRGLKAFVRLHVDRQAGDRLDLLQKLMTDGSQGHSMGGAYGRGLPGGESGRHSVEADKAKVAKRGTSRQAPGNVNDRQLILYQFSREKVERGDFSAFLSQFGADRLPSGPALAGMMGSIVFAVEAYDADSREIYAIPEVRKFYGAFHRAWPYWLYFCDLNQDSLKTMVLCCLPSLTAVARQGRPLVGVELDPLELLRWVAADFDPMNALCERAGLSERAIYDRSKAVFEYFGFPYDAPPPE